MADETVIQSFNTVQTLPEAQVVAPVLEFMSAFVEHSCSNMYVPANAPTLTPFLRLSDNPEDQT